MRTIEDLRNRIASVRDVQSIVSTMKTMAAVQVRQYESAANAMTDYLRTVELGFHVLQQNGKLPFGSSQQPLGTVANLRGTPTRRAAVVFGSDQGLCGKFNEVIVNHAVSDFADNSNSWSVIVVGNRSATLLDSALEGSDSVNIEHVFRTPITVSDITGVMQRLMPIVDQWQLDGVFPIDVYFNSRKSASTYGADSFRLFPISTEFLARCREKPWNSRRLPIYTMDHQALLAAVVRQYLFVGLYRACAESRASENTSRIAAMQAASKNIDRRLHELKSEFNESRQAAITEEILDIASGVEALR